MAAQEDFTHLIERLDAFEERLGVSFEALRAGLGERRNLAGDVISNGIIIYGQLHSREGTQIAEDIELFAESYDYSGRILVIDNTYVSKEKFFGFETFKLYLQNVVPDEVSKIRIYPKKR